jgi:hypothetical protein
MSIVKQIQAFLAVSEVFLRQSGVEWANEYWLSQDGTGGVDDERAMLERDRLPDRAFGFAVSGEAAAMINQVIWNRSAIMLAKADFTDPWLQTLGLLSALSGDVGGGVSEADVAKVLAPAARKGSRLPVMGELFDVQVYVIDRPTQSTATVVWRDSMHCSYGDQVWHASRARAAGVCAMSGRAIRAGDAIYKPRPCRPAPLNAGAMILRAVVHAAAEEWGWGFAVGFFALGSGGVSVVSLVVY